MEANAGNPYHGRLLALLRAGYAITLRDSTKDTLDLRHPSRRRIPTGETDLYLLPDGAVLTTKSDAEGFPITIHIDDDQEFNSLLSRIPAPTWWEINQGKVIDRAVLLVMIFLFVVAIARST